MLVPAGLQGRQFSCEDPSGGAVGSSSAAGKAPNSNRGVIEVSALHRAPARQGGSQTQDKHTPWLARQDLIGVFALF